MTISDQELYAWLDGELTPARSAEVEQAAAPWPRPFRPWRTRATRRWPG